MMNLIKDIKNLPKSVRKRGWVERLPEKKRKELEAVVKAWEADEFRGLTKLDVARKCVEALDLRVHVTTVSRIFPTLD